MLWFKKKPKVVEPPKPDPLDEALTELFNKLGFDIQAMVKEAIDSADKKDLERLELMLTTCKAEMDKAIKEGFTSGQVEVPLADWKTYCISPILAEKVYKKYGIKIQYYTNEYYDCTNLLSNRPETKGYLSFNMEKR